MSTAVSSERLANEALSLLDETFEKVVGIYLDRQTSLNETLAATSALEASTPPLAGGSSIAGHVTHIRLYLRILNDYMNGVKHSNLDWKQSWLVVQVTAAEWDQLREDLRADYASLKERWKNQTDWAKEDWLGGALAIIVHTAYHLGAIRQMILFVRKSGL
jgi:hypothetical protein